MTNFPKDSKQKTRVRNMETSLIFFLGVEVMFGALEFFFMSPVVLHSYKIIKIFFIIWIPNLVIASFFFLAVKPGIFAMYRAGFRMIHFTVIANIYYWYRLMPVSVCTIGLCVVEFICLVDGVSNEKMTYPGQWILTIVHKLRKSPQETAIEMISLHSSTNDNFLSEVNEKPFARELDTSLHYSSDEDSIPPFSSLEPLGIFVV
ncbi:hypothetical protein GCK72_026115 [Caenorhabditis remanei]|uniref:Uncharacterized protein n=1 Tax=Caenorhabditis remanei TaxID=31234 RepID=A0A6A5G3Y6_CAERE|nr:hypothetical protein GCK72_026115 [Caenorhabditis remanei]KAF1749647.1 hypothetical protein GCK72_026115 [Caenorhabditis remanei]